MIAISIIIEPLLLLNVLQSFLLWSIINYG